MNESKIEADSKKTVKKGAGQGADTVDKKNAGKKSRGVQLVISILCFCIFIGCAIYLGKYYLEIKTAQDGVSDLKEFIITPMDSVSGDSGESDEIEYVEIQGRMVQAKFAELYQMNPDFIGWITIEDTKVDYPVMQNMDENEYYIHRNFNKTYDGSGLPFLDYRCDIQEPTANLLIYGHNMKAGTMFAQIMKYGDQDFYQEHPTFTFDTIDGDGEYEVVAAFYSQVYPEDDTTSFKYYEFFDAESEEEFNAYIDNILRLSCIQTGVVPEYGDSLITLSTCAYHTEDGRFAVVARKIE